MINNEWDNYHNYLRKNGISYTQYLNSEHWKNLRKRFYKQLRFKNYCEACKSRKQLNLHHKTYARIGREKLSDLALLCRSCHKKVHRQHSRNRLSLCATTEALIRNKGKSNLSLWDWLFGAKRRFLSKF